MATRWLQAALVTLAAAQVAGCAERVTSAEIYRRATERSVSMGLMRTDFAPADAPYDNGDLVRNFEKVVFDPEAQLVEIDPANEDRVYVLRRWTQPIGYHFVGSGVRTADRRVMEDLAERMAAHIGLSIAPAGLTEANMRIYVLDEAERRELLRGLAARDIDIANTVLERWLVTYEVPCAGIMRVSTDEDGAIVWAAIVIKDELEDILRSACFHEEFVQSLGLTNDHDSVRPSLFNDGNEFALVTEHDTYLLRILYSDALRPGMTRAQAMPEVPAIVEALRPGG